jgi:hypothetical protein
MINDVRHPATPACSVAVAAEPQPQPPVAAENQALPGTDLVVATLMLTQVFAIDRVAVLDHVSNHAMTPTTTRTP